MNKFLYLILSSCLLLVSCQQNELAPEAKISLFQAEVESFTGGITKTSLVKNNIVWSENDMLLIYEGGCAGNLYKLTDDSAGKSNASFTVEEYIGTENQFSHNVAVYPASIVNDFEAFADGFRVYVTIPQIQEFVNGSFVSNSFPMTAVTSSIDDKNLKFRNVFGALKLSLRGTEFIRSITLIGNNGEVLAGNAEVIFSSDGTSPEVKMNAEGSKELTIDCGPGCIQLNEFKTTEFVFSLPPVKFENGFNFIIQTLDSEYILAAEIENTVYRSSVLTMPLCTIDGTLIEVVDEPLLEITSINPVRVDIKVNLGDIERFYGDIVYVSYTAEDVMRDVYEYVNGGYFRDMTRENEYPYGFEGDANIFFYGNPGGAYLLPGHEYAIYYLPYIEDKTDYTIDEVFYQTFTMPMPQGGSSIEMQYSTVTNIPGRLDIELIYDSERAGYYYSWITESVYEYYKEDPVGFLLNCYFERYSLSHSCDVFESGQYYFVALPVDYDGLYGKPLVVSCLAQDMSFNNIEVNVSAVGDIQTMGGGEFEIEFSESVSAYRYVVISGTNYDWEELEKSMSAGYLGYWCSFDNPVDSFTLMISDYLSAGYEYTLLVMAIDATGRASHAGRYSFYPVPSESDLSNWSIVGYQNGWDNDMWLVNDGNYLVYKNFTINTFETWSNTGPLEFKFRKDSSWDQNFGATYLEPHNLGEPYPTVSYGPNIMLPDNGTYDIYLSKYLNKYYIMSPGEKPSDYVNDASGMPESGTLDKLTGKDGVW